jgi:hypothetical protein
LEIETLNFVVIGTDHRMQHSEAGFEGLLRAWIGVRYVEPLTAIAEEYHEAIGHSSVAQRLAAEYGLRWYNLDMTIEEKQTAGILEEQRNRPRMFEEAITVRVSSDDIRENAWAEKLIQSASGTTIAICGYLHYESLVAKLREKGHSVDKRLYLEIVPAISIADSFTENQ